jgi:UDP-N-acetylmuramoyl-L-alanine---L-glutamate ligase
MLAKEAFIHHFINFQKVSILGFGQEGQSTYRTIRKYLPYIIIHICDRNQNLRKQQYELVPNDPMTTCFFGPDYLLGVAETDIVIKSPGIPFNVLDTINTPSKITSQTELFVTLFREQIIGITGTKGKSTTASLLYHIYQQAEIPSVFVGNIGIPPFDILSGISDNTRIIYEMSSHQLEHIRISPHKAILLNIYQEHLDHYPTFDHYKQAKLNIARYQTDKDTFIVNASNPHIKHALKGIVHKAQQILLGKEHDCESCIYYQGEDLIISVRGRHGIIKALAGSSPLRGPHNLLNLAAAASVAWLDGIDTKTICHAAERFKSLPHRLEFAGSYMGITFYNDSIATIPESTIAAIETFPQTDAIILGGFDRGVDYQLLIDFVGKSAIQTLIFTGEAGKRMFNLTRQQAAYSNKRCIFTKNFDDAFRMAVAGCKHGGICLLSPAAASYDAFKDFKERGDRFKQLIQELNKQI